MPIALVDLQAVAEGRLDHVDTRLAVVRVGERRSTVAVGRGGGHRPAFIRTTQDRERDRHFGDGGAVPVLDHRRNRGRSGQVEG